jgi:Asp-tRNA(Asn)/Glu-tRNA(Gln) amidotransferase A subunit family amidase
MNLAGVPCLSLPVGELQNGMPFNISLTARQGREDVLVALGRSIEDTLDRRFAERIASAGPS